MRLFAVMLLGWAGLLAGCLPMGVSMIGQATVMAVGDVRRLDQRLADDLAAATVFANLQQDARTAGLVIWAYAYGGHMILLGEKSRPEDDMAVRSVAQAVPGVRDVTLHLFDRQGETLAGASRDALITGQVKAAIFQSPDLVYQRFSVKTIQNHVFLLGVAGSEEEARRACSRTREAAPDASLVALLWIPQGDTLRPFDQNP